jgi:hypothetical protein
MTSTSIRKGRSKTASRKKSKNGFPISAAADSGMTRRGEQLTARSIDVNEMKIFDDVNMNTSVWSS